MVVLTALLALAVSHSPAAHADLPRNPLAAGWNDIFEGEFRQPYYHELDAYLRAERNQRIVYPNESETFTAFEMTSFNDVRVVIVGQDPYQTAEKEADGSEVPYGYGLAFSVRPNIRKTPGSLQNIFKKLNRDLNVPIPRNGNLDHWAAQGILMMNTTLTVERGVAGSHIGMPNRKTANWGIFTEAILRAIASRKQNVVFVLWGKPAQEKAKLLAQYPGRGHLILQGVHPSPLSPLATSQFVEGEKFFNEIDAKLAPHPIRWASPSSPTRN